MTVAEQQQQQQQHLIDGLLQRYLGLLDDYTTLRRQLCDLQASVYQHIARANYTAERGLRYGSDHYDGRMRATRRLSIRKDEAGVGVYAVNLAAAHPGSQTPPAAVDRQAQPWTEASSAAANPLRWFGLLAPAPLRAAQELSVEIVERVIPRLLSVRAEMLHLEIKMRRARELRAKEDVLPGGEILSLA